MLGRMVCHYRILEKIGQGGMGEIFLAEDTKLKRQVALKFLPRQMTADPDARERFEREAQAAAALNHPNIVTVHEIGEHEGQIFITMECVEGRTLKEIIDAGARRAVPLPITPHPLPIAQVIEIAIQLASGLAAAHAKGIVHRDIKPQNILIDKSNHVKILDFGLVKLKGVSSLTKESSTLGTVHYMSPEQTLGKEVDHRTDIWSLGAVMYEMLTGRLPFQGEYEQAVIYSIINEAPQPVTRYNSHVSADLERILTKALAKDQEERYQHADELLADLRRERKSLEYVKAGQVSRMITPPRARKQWPIAVVAAAAVAAAAILIFLFSPFKVRVGPAESARARENSLAVMYFENLQDPEDRNKTSQMITALLTTGLSDSPRYLQVVSSQRLYDILKLLGKEGLKVIDKSVATEVARRADVHWMVTGKILKEEPNIVLVSEISDAATGRILATQKVNGGIGEDLFAVVDQLSPQLVKALALPEQAISALKKPVASMTTRSREAYRCYVEAREYFYKIYLKEATESLAQALQFDPAFAEAYNLLAMIHFTSGDYQQAKKNNLLAQKYASSLSHKEKLFVMIMMDTIAGNFDRAIQKLHEMTDLYPDDKYGYTWLGIIHGLYLDQHDEAIRQLRRAVAIDPLNKIAYNMLSYYYESVGDIEKSLWAINQYIALAPGEANPYDSRGDLYAYSGQADKAIASYQKALALNPNFSNTRERIGFLHMFMRNYSAAEKVFNELAASSEPEARASARLCMALVHMYQGKFRLALKTIDEGIRGDRLEKGPDGEPGSRHFQKAMIFEAQGDWERAIRETEKGLDLRRQADPDAPLSMRDYLVYLLSSSGHEASAEAVVRELETQSSQRKSLQFQYWRSAGFVARMKGDLQNAVMFFEKGKVNNFRGQYALASAYLEQGSAEKAAVLLEKMLTRHNTSKAYSPIHAVKAYYLLGQAYEKSGRNVKAILKYNEFLDIWKDADPGLPEIAAARQRLAELKKQ